MKKLLARASAALRSAPLFSIATLALFGVGLALRLWVASLSPEEMIERNLPDEAFFYLRIGWNLGTGVGSTWDGMNLTSGYHPLWVFLLSLLPRFFTDYHGSYYHASMVLQALLGLVPGVFLFRSARLISERRSLALLGLALYFLNPRILFVTMNGMDTAVTLAFASALLFLFLRFWLGQPGESSRFFLLTGSTAGMLFLARTDTVFLIAAVFLAIAARERRRLARVLTPLVLPAAAIIGAWVAWNIATFGSFSQASAYAPTLGARMAAGLDRAGLFFNIKYSLWSLVGDLPFFAKMVGMGVPLAILLGAGYVMTATPAIGEEERERLGRRILALAIPAAGLSCAFVVHSAIRFYNRDYYTTPWNLVSILFLIAAFDALWRLRASRRTLLAAALLFFVAGSFVLTYRREYRAEVARIGGSNPSTIAVARWANAHLPPEARIGSIKHAGTLSFWSERTVVNLDGKENDAVIPYLRERRLWEYLKENRIEYLADPEEKAFGTRRVFFGDTDLAGKVEKVFTADQSVMGYPVQAVSLFRLRFE